MDKHHHSHPPAFRSFSTHSALSLSSSSTMNTGTPTPSASRINLSGPSFNLNNFNKQSDYKEHLFYKCEVLKQRLLKIDGMKPYMHMAFQAAEKLSEQQALSLAQERDLANGAGARLEMGMGIDLERLSIQSNASSLLQSSSSVHQTQPLSTQNTQHSANTTLRNSSHSYNGLVVNDTLLTFAAGVLPANISVDPVTQIWKLFQQGSPLCLIFNHVMTNKEQQLTIVTSDDLRICKKSVYDFLSGCKLFLDYKDDEYFTISDVFSSNTQDLLKVITFINKVLDNHSANQSKSDLTYDGNNEEQVLQEGKEFSNLNVQITDERSKVFREIIETERKYVLDLELLLTYRNKLLEAEVLSQEQIHMLFPNITEIVDFQRRFLNGLESNINVPVKYQRLGSVFIHASLGPFKAYEPWTIGQLAANDLIIKEAANLRKSSTLIDPGFELQSFILKPIQRLCKYPLLLKELIKHSPEASSKSSDAINDPSQSSINELYVARTAMKEVANQVNEAQRRAENVEYMHKLMERVKDWRGFNLRDQGELLHHGVVGIKDSEVEKEYVAYLFEKIIFFFMEVELEREKLEKKPEKKSKFGSRKKSSSSASYSSLGTPHSSTSNLLDSLNGKTDRSLTPLELRGRVYIREIYNISSSPSSSSSTSTNTSTNTSASANTSSPNGYTLIISWSGKKESGSFTLKYRLEETRNQWEQSLRNLYTMEMNNSINKKLRDSQSSFATNDSTIYEYTGNPNNTESPQQLYFNGNGASQQQQQQPRHFSSSSTHSMMHHRLSHGNAMNNTTTATTSNNNNGNNTHASQYRTKSGDFSRHSSSSTTLSYSNSNANTSTALSSATTMTTTTATAATGSGASTEDSISIKVIHNTSELPEPLIVSPGISFTDLYSKINNWVSSKGGKEEGTTTISKIRYKDEDGDFVVMDSNEDWNLAMDEMDAQRSLTIWVS